MLQKEIRKEADKSVKKDEMTFFGPKNFKARILKLNHYESVIKASQERYKDARNNSTLTLKSSYTVIFSKRLMGHFSGFFREQLMMPQV